MAWFARLLLLTGCAADAAEETAASYAVEALSGPTQEGFARAVEPAAFVWPDDHGAHPEYQTEWWYFTGNLADEAGERIWLPAYVLSQFADAGCAGASIGLGQRIRCIWLTLR